MQGSIAMYEFISEGTKKSVGLDCGNVNFTKCQKKKKNSKKAKKGKLQGKRNPKGEKKVELEKPQQNPAKQRWKQYIE